MTAMRGLLVSLVTAAAITPPVIHEPFTALPCPLHPDTTIDVVGCQEHRVLRGDRAIDAQAGAIFRLLRTPSARATFVAAEGDWLRYRRHSCSAEASKLDGGSLHPVAILSCEIQRNRSHLADLTATRKALSRR